MFIKCSFRRTIISFDCCLELKKKQDSYDLTYCYKDKVPSQRMVLYWVEHDSCVPVCHRALLPGLEDAELHQCQRIVRRKLK